MSDKYKIVVTGLYCYEREGWFFNDRALLSLVQNGDKIQPLFLGEYDGGTWGPNEGWDDVQNSNLRLWAAMPIIQKRRTANPSAWRYHITTTLPAEVVLWDMDAFDSWDRLGTVRIAKSQKNQRHWFKECTEADARYYLYFDLIPEGATVLVDFSVRMTAAFEKVAGGDKVIGKVMASPQLDGLSSVGLDAARTSVSNELERIRQSAQKAIATQFKKPSMTPDQASQVALDVFTARLGRIDEDFLSQPAVAGRVKAAIFDAHVQHAIDEDVLGHLRAISDVSSRNPVLGFLPVDDAARGKLGDQIGRRMGNGVTDVKKRAFAKLGKKLSLRAVDAAAKAAAPEIMSRVGKAINAAALDDAKELIFQYPAQILSADLSRRVVELANSLPKPTGKRKGILESEADDAITGMKGHGISPKVAKAIADADVKEVSELGAMRRVSKAKTHKQGRPLGMTTTGRIKGVGVEVFFDLVMAAAK